MNTSENYEAHCIKEKIQKARALLWTDKNEEMRWADDLNLPPPREK
jgi:hypothetical protein